MRLFLSPHLDDAVLSCGGTIHQLTQRGQDVTILTVMAGDPPDPLPASPIVRELHSRWQAGETPVAVRRQEDSAAAQVLGAKVIHQSIPDCIYRTVDGQPIYLDNPGLFGAVHPEDPAHSQLARMTLPPGISTLYAPLGVGNHVDHQLVRDWALKIAHQQPAVVLKFYEEYPYNDDTIAIDSALSHFTVHLMPEYIALTAADIQAKIAAVRCHQSQISTFWADTQQMAHAIRAALQPTDDDQPVERYRVR